MKQLNRFSLIVLALFLTVYSHAQDETSITTPRWASTKGYWVVQSNIHTPLSHVISFYNPQHEMMYTERLEGVKLNPKKRKVKMKLKKALEAAYIAWEKGSPGTENKLLVAKALGK